MLRAQIVGATGYGGLGMVELMLGHPDWEIVFAQACGEAGRRLDDLYPHLAGRCDLVVERVETTPIGEDCDVVVIATPSGEEPPGVDSGTTATSSTTTRPRAYVDGCGGDANALMSHHS